MKKRRKLLNRISTFVCALVVLVSCMIGSIEFKAAILSTEINDYVPFICSNMDQFVNSSVTVPDTFPEKASQFQYYYLAANSSQYRLVLSDMPIKVRLSSNVSDSFTSISLQPFVDPASSSTLFRCDIGSTNWTESSTSAYGLGTYFDFEDDSRDNVSLTFGFVGCNHAIKLDGYDNTIFDENGVFNGASDSYNSALGYLQNVNGKRLFIHGDTNRTQTKLKFTFDTKTTTGVDLTTGNYVIKLYEQTSIYKNGLWQPFDTPKVLIGDYNAGGGSLEFNIADAMQKTDDVTGDIEGYNMLTIALNGYVRTDTYWLQVYNPTTNEYGGYVKIESNPDNGLMNSTTVSGEDGYTEDTSNGYVDDYVDVPSGEGTNYEDAELNADKEAAELEGFDAFAESLNNMTAAVSAIPRIIGSLFSFLPDWCLLLCAAGFGFMILLIVIKTARG